MRTHGARPGQMAAMVIFAFSCFGLLLFLWLSFGGPIPLKPKGYEVKASFPQATTLAEQADVRVAGVSIGKVVKLQLDPAGNRTLATLEIQRAYAPLHRDAKAILRQKTLLGETYVEMTLGHKGAPTIPEGGRLANARIEPSVQLDQVLQLFPKQTRDDFRRWQANAARVIRGRGADLNAALGNLGPFAEGGEGVFTTLDRRRAMLRALVDQGGAVFEALTRDENRLRAFIGDTARWFRATASEKERLAESVHILPTFLRESRLTLARVGRFSRNAKPLVDDLGPVARDLRPTLVDLRQASPDLQSVFRTLPALTTQSATGLPALSRVLRGLGPVLAVTGPFLRELNPILAWLEYEQGTVANFITGPASGLAGKVTNPGPGWNGHILPQVVVIGSQMTIAPRRTADNRGNTYIKPEDLNANGYRTGYNTLPSWDCNNTTVHKAAPGDPGCFVAGPYSFQGKTEKFPHVLAGGFKPAGG